jgi:hypothetical protein
MLLMRKSDHNKGTCLLKGEECFQYEKTTHPRDTLYL